MHNRLKKSFAVFIAALLLISSVPVFASAAVSLTYRNIEIVVPTVTPNEIKYGQTLGELTVSGGEVWYNGTQVPGYFTVNNAALVPDATDSYEVMLKFVPTDSNYTCRATLRKDTATYTGTWPTVKVKAEAVASLSEAPVASSVIGGYQLATSQLSGGRVVNSEGSDITSLGTWSWEKPTTIVNENATYTAKWTSTNNDYNIVTVDIPVTIEYKVEVNPTLSSLSYEYFDGISTDDLDIVPGVVKTADGTADVPGTYSFESRVAFGVVGSNAIYIVFTPDDTNLKSSKFAVFFEITKGTIVFSDDENNEVVPEITVPYGTKFDTYLSNLIAEYVNIGENVWIYFRDIDGNEYDYSGTTPGLGTKTYKVTAIPYNSSTSNYKATELEFKLTIEPLEVTPSITAYGNDEYVITTGDYTTKPQGTFDLYANDELVMEDIAYLTRFTWRPVKSGIYTLKAVYNPVDNDTFKVNDAVRTDLVLNLTWGISAVNSTAKPCAYGDTAVVKHSLGNKFAGWVFYDENGNEFTPENVVADTSTSSVSFTMPDFAITVKALSTDDAGDGDASSSGMLGWLQRLIKWISDIVSHILNFWNGL